MHLSLNHQEVEVAVEAVVISVTSVKDSGTQKQVSFICFVFKRLTHVVDVTALQIFTRIAILRTTAINIIKNRAVPTTVCAM
jgi:hypothetical protein